MVKTNKPRMDGKLLNQIKDRKRKLKASLGEQKGEERFATFQIHRKTSRARQKQHYQAIVMIPAAIRRELGWDKGDVLSLKVLTLNGEGRLQIRKVGDADKLT